MLISGFEHHFASSMVTDANKYSSQPRHATGSARRIPGKQYYIFCVNFFQNLKSSFWSHQPLMSFEISAVNQRTRFWRFCSQKASTELVTPFSVAQMLYRPIIRRKMMFWVCTGREIHQRPQKHAPTPHKRGIRAISPSAKPSMWNGLHTCCFTLFVAGCRRLHLMGLMSC